MTSTSARPSLRAAGRRGGRGAVVAGHVVAGLVVGAGIVAQVARPVAPELGAVPDPGSLFGEDLLARAEAYRAPLRVAGLGALAVQVGVPLLAVLSPAGRRAVEALGRRLGARHPALAGAAVAVGIAVATEVVALPLSYWAGYVHEGAWGFRTQGLGGWARDWLVLRVPGWAGIAVLAAGGLTLARCLPRGWPPVAGLAAGALAALVVFVSPVVLEPLVYRMTPLPPGPVRDEVVRVLDAADARVGALLVADASRRTTKQNAYVSGLVSTRRVVLLDTLLAGRTPEEVGLVLAHELGHDRNHDVARGALLGAAGTVVAAYAAAGVLRLRRLDPSKAPARAVAVVLATLVVCDVASLPLQMAVSRRQERAADVVSLQLTDAPETFRSMQEGLTVANLPDLRPPRWAYLLWWTHPTASERIGRALEW